MRRPTTLLLVLLIAWVAIWGLASLLVPGLVASVLDYAIPAIERAGITVDALEYRDIAVSPSLTSVSADAVTVAFDLSPTDDITLSSSFKARGVTVRLTHLLRLRGSLILDDFEVSLHETDRPRKLFFHRLTEGHLRIDDLPLLSPRRAMIEVFNGLETIFLENASADRFELRGDVEIRVQDREFPAHLYTERKDGASRLRFRESDIQAVADEVAVDLSSEQIEIVSLYPVRVPFLIRITRQAEDLSRRSFPGDRWLEDAMRHVSWSFLLTREFGADFATTVTDAQETRTGNTPDERAMDFHNNAVGRRLANRGVSLRDLPRIVRQDPRVIRHPSEVVLRTDLLR